jgi:hypothetical protein
MKREDEFVLHDNTSQHASLRAMQTISKLLQTVAPDLAPSDFHLPVPLKNAIRRRKFRNDNNITAELRTWLQNTPENSYQQAIQALVSTRREVNEKDEHYAENRRLQIRYLNICIMTASVV